METFDLEQTARIAALITAPRDEAWCENFLRAAPNASFTALTPQIQNGPDTLPYFQLAMPDPGQFIPFSIVHVMDYVLDRGAGIVVHPTTRRDQPPLWVFSFGDILAYKLFQDFKGDPKVYNDKTPPNPADREILKAAPSDSYLPPTARAALGRFMRGPFGHPDPRIGLVTGASLSPRQALMLNLRLSNYGGDRAKLDAALRYLTWFVPKSYSLIPLPDEWPDADMAPV